MQQALVGSCQTLRLLATPTWLTFTTAHGAPVLQAHKAKVAEDMQAFHRQHAEAKAAQAEARAKEEERLRQQAQQQAAAEAAKVQAQAERKRQQNKELRWADLAAWLAHNGAFDACSKTTLVFL